MSSPSRGRQLSPQTSQERNVRQRRQPEPIVESPTDVLTTSETLESPEQMFHNQIKSDAQKVLLSYLRNQGKTNMIARSVSFLGTFFDDLLLANTIKNRELALTYILELKYVGVNPDVIRLLSEKAILLTNTSIYEKELLDATYDLLFTINNLYQIYDLVNVYNAKLLETGLPEFTSNALSHNFRLFLLSIYITRLWEKVNKELSMTYLEEVKPYIPLESYTAILQRINTKLTSNGEKEQHLITTCRVATVINVMLKDELPPPLTSEQLTELNSLLFRIDGYEQLQNSINRGLKKAYIRLTQYFWNELGTVSFYVNTIRLFFKAVLTRQPLDVDLLNIFIDTLTEYFSDGVINFVRTYVNGPDNPPQEMNTVLNELFTTANLIGNEYDALLRNAGYIKIKYMTPFRKLSSKGLSPITSSRKSDIILPENIPDEYIGFVNKIYKFQNKHGLSCNNIDAIRMELFTKGQKYILPEPLNIFDVNPEYCLAKAFYEWSGLPKQEQIRFSLLDINSGFQLNIKYAEQAGIGIGVVRDFFQRCIDELLKFNVFIKMKESDRYVLNPKFRPNKSFKEIAGLDFNTVGDYDLLYEFIGKLLNLVLLNDIGLHFNLSFGILYAMLNGRKVNTGSEELVACYMMDRPEEAVGLINLMKTPKAIASVAEDLELFIEKELPGPLNRPTETVISKIPVTSENYLQFLKEKALSEYIMSINKLVPGFRPVNKLLQSNKSINLFTLDKMLSYESVNMESVKLLIESIELNSDDTPAKRSVVKILSEKGRSILGFVEKLLSFWTSSKHYIPTFNYSVVMIQTAAESEKLPESHTCFRQLDIPSSYAGNVEKVYKKLRQAVELVETGIGMYGGRGKK